MRVEGVRFDLLAKPFWGKTPTSVACVVLRVCDLEFRIYDLGFMVYGLWFGVACVVSVHRNVAVPFLEGSAAEKTVTWFGVWGSWFGVVGLGSRSWGLDCPPSSPQSPQWVRSGLGLRVQG